jgi:hypothetical protein
VFAGGKAVVAVGSTDAGGGADIGFDVNWARAVTRNTAMRRKNIADKPNDDELS